MALGVALIILPFAQLGVVIWFGALGVVLLGRWPAAVRRRGTRAGPSPGDRVAEGPPQARVRSREAGASLGGDQAA